jgi:glycosyltransferase involved in cell wall biosynthesis
MTSPQNFRYTFTVFTPTYNRADLLPRVYESLQKQTFRDFEWRIVDGGSTDKSEEIVRAWQVNSPFPIRYFSEPGEGKNAAINRGAREAEGRFVAILDSDDWYVPQSLERFLHHWNQIPALAQAGFVGVTGLCAYPSGELIGTRFPQDIFDSDAIDLRFRHKVLGDKNGILRTEVLRQYPFPPELGKFIGESVIWNRIAKSYKTRFVNEVLTIKEYQQAGLTSKVQLLWVRDVRASLLYSKELISLGARLPFNRKIRAYANYVRLSLHQGTPFCQQAADIPSKAMLFLCYPLGIYLKTRDAAFLARERRREGNLNP